MHDLGLIESLRARLREEADHYEATAPYAIVDFPNHANVGDSAIYLGELVQLQELFGQPPRYVCDVDNYSADELREALPSGTIFIHGGGNFGDIWLEQQRLRETVIRDFPDRRIVQLPQTVHFNQAEAAEKAAAVISEHPNFMLFVRDEESRKKAAAYFNCPIRLAPDSAFFLGPIDRPVRSKRNLLFLLRTDQESSGASLHLRLPPGATREDWLEEDRHLETKGRIRMRLSIKKPQGKIAQRVVLYQELAQNRVDRGLRQLSLANYVITDRLHAHILCLLLGIPHTVLDNSYGKLSTFIAAWTKESTLLKRAGSIDEAVRDWKTKMTITRVQEISLRTMSS